MQFSILRKPTAAILIVSMSLLSIGNFAPPASAQLPVPVAGAGVAAGIASLAVGVTSLVRGIVGDDNKKREAFTQQTIAQLNQKYPDYNAVISHNGGTVEGNSVVHQHVELPMAVGTCGYEIYLSPKGQHFKFVRNGDGGFINWAFGGEFSRDDNTITAN